MRRTIFEQLMHEAKYAQNSNSKCLLYEVHGKAIMARELGAITHEESIILNTETVRFMNEHPRELNLC
jgi:hypothetical protein